MADSRAGAITALVQKLKARIDVADRVASNGRASNVMVYVPFELAEQILAFLVEGPQVSPERPTFDPALGPWDLASRVAGALRAEGIFVPENLLRTHILLAQSDIEKAEQAHSEPGIVWLVEKLRTRARALNAHWQRLEPTLAADCVHAMNEAADRLSPEGGSPDR